jgi:hypothetical protein
LIAGLRRDAFTKVALGPASSSRHRATISWPGPRIVTINQPAVDTIKASVGVGVDGTPATWNGLGPDSLRAEAVRIFAPTE